MGVAYANYFRFRMHDVTDHSTSQCDWLQQNYINDSASFCNIKILFYAAITSFYFTRVDG